MDERDIKQNLDRVREAIARAAARAGRSPSEVLLIGVSKTVEAERIALAVAAGVPALGENRVQEAKEKIEALGRPVPWHLIGHLQTNKARDAARLFDWIHSVDRLELAQELDRRARALDRVLDVLLEVNVGEEPQKSGARPGEVKALLDACAGLGALRVRGLMAIPPAALDPELTRPHFRRLRELRDGAGLEHLSMGMSADYEVAVEEGATMVRVGTAIFGARAPRSAA
jgi:PLP dependent protein